MVFDVAFAVNQETALQPGISHESAGMQPFEKDRIIVTQQVFNQVRRHPAGNDVGFDAEVGQESHIAMVIIYRFTVFFKFRGGFALVKKTMQVDFETGLIQCPDFVENINHAAVVGRVGNVERDDM